MGVDHLKAVGQHKTAQLCPRFAFSSLPYLSQPGVALYVIVKRACGLVVSRSREGGELPFPQRTPSPASESHNSPEPPPTRSKPSLSNLGPNIWLRAGGCDIATRENPLLCCPRR